MKVEDVEREMETEKQIAEAEIKQAEEDNVAPPEEQLDEQYSTLQDMEGKCNVVPPEVQ